MDNIDGIGALLFIYLISLVFFGGLAALIFNLIVYNRVKTFSTRLKWINSLNSQFRFYTDIQSFSYNISKATKRQFDRFDFDDFLRVAVSENRKFYTDMINKCEYNSNKYLEYISSIQTIPGDSIVADARKCFLSVDRYERLENKFIKSRILREPSRSFTITCNLSYVSPKGRNRYFLPKRYSYDEIKQALSYTHPQNISQDVNVINGSNNSTSQSVAESVNDINRERNTHLSSNNPKITPGSSELPPKSKGEDNKPKKKNKAKAAEIIPNKQVEEYIDTIEEIKPENKEKADADVEAGLIIIGNVLVKYYGQAERVIIPDRVKEIGEKAFFNNKTIKSVIIPDGVTIGDDAFRFCEKLVRVCYDNKIWNAGHLGERAFLGCSNLNSVIRINGTVVRCDTFYNCKSIEHVILPKMIDLNENAFHGCECLETVAEGEDFLILGKLGEGAFAECKNLRTIFRITDFRIPAYTFSGCEMLRSVDVSDGADLQEYAFEDCKRLRTICEGRSVFVAGMLGTGAFSGCENLSIAVEVTENVVRENTFFCCMSLRKVLLPDDVTFEKDAFAFCIAPKIKRGDNSESNGIHDRNESHNGKNEEIESEYDGIIGFKDIVVKTESYHCNSYGHDFRVVCPVLFCLTKYGDIEARMVSAGYCTDCKCYFILDHEMDWLKTDCVILCRVVDNSAYYYRGTWGFSYLNRESIIKQYGYTVNRKVALSSTQRQTILEFIVAAKVLTKDEVCEHLDRLIASKSSDERYRNAIEKWTEDRVFIVNYQLTEERKAIVDRITKGK